VQPFKNSTFASIVAVPLTRGEVKVALTEACQAGIFTGLSIVPISVSNSTVTSSGTRIGIPLLSSIVIVIVDVDSPSAVIFRGSAESFRLICNFNLFS